MRGTERIGDFTVAGTFPDSSAEEGLEVEATPCRPRVTGRTGADNGMKAAVGETRYGFAGGSIPWRVNPVHGCGAKQTHKAGSG
jgi:hypothetical protein